MFRLSEDFRMNARPAQRRAAHAGLLVAALASAAGGQELTDDMVGQSQKTWRLWSQATSALDKNLVSEAAKPFEDLAALPEADLSPLRLALMADRTGTLRFEQAVESGEVGEFGKTLLERIKLGRKQRMLAEDGWHFAAIGRFAYADANFKALVESSPDPVALLELSRYNPNRHLILVKLMANTEVGPSARAFMDLLGQGEEKLRQDPFEISVNVQRLAGTPRMVFHAVNNLKASGEYAVPQLLRVLQDASQPQLRAPIIQVLPELGRAAMNPLVVALDLPDQAIKQVIIEALARLGYRQALPYLARIAEGADAGVSAEVRGAAREAMQKIDPTSSSLPAAALFHDLAEGYHRDLDSLRADPRLSAANVWYLRDGRLVYRTVPREIFNDVMAMRCCEMSLALHADSPASAALWLASNIRREAKLSLDVESEQADPRAARDTTRPEDYPRSIYFARCAGPLHNHLVLARAVHDRDPGVALGAIAALSATAGESSLLGPEQAKAALIDALAFPHRLVRIKAALCISRTLPRAGFERSHHVVPVLNEALTLSTRKVALVVDPDDQLRNKFQAVLRAANIDTIAADRLYAALDAARQQSATGFDLIVLASDISGPELDKAVLELRGDFATAATPMILVAKAGQTGATDRAARSTQGAVVMLADVVAGGSAEEATQAVSEYYRRAAATLGVADITDELALSLALEAADALRMLAITGGSVLDIQRSEAALITALAGKHESLSIKAASALALLGSANAQEAVAQAALDAARTSTLRIAAFASLAESARRFGNRLSEATINRLVETSLDAADLVIRTAASQALGALDLPANRINEIIKRQSQG